MEAPIMPVQDAHVYAVQEAILTINNLATHARAPYMIKYYNFQVRNLTALLVVLREPPANPKKSWFQPHALHTQN